MLFSSGPVFRRGNEIFLCRKLKLLSLENLGDVKVKEIAVKNSLNTA
jgi:hypothetical protein